MKKSEVEMMNTALREGKPKKCEGSCEEHRGEVVRVKVTDTGKDWGEFDYCQEAIEEDKRRGLEVHILYHK